MSTENNTIYLYNRFKCYKNTALDFKNSSLLLIADINIQKIIPIFVKNLFNHNSTLNLNAILTTLETIVANFQKDNQIQWFMLEQYLNKLDYEPIKKALEKLILEYKNNPKYPRSFNKHIKSVVSLITTVLKFYLSSSLNSDDFKKEWQKYLTNSFFINYLKNYSSIHAIPGVTAIEKEFSAETKKYFPLNKDNHLIHEEGFSLNNLEETGPYSIVNNNFEKKQLNHLDSSFCEQLNIISELLERENNICSVFDELLYEEYILNEKKYISYVLYVQNEFLRFVKHYREKKNFNLNLKSFVALFIIDYIKCHPIIHSNNIELNLSTKKMEGINTNHKEIIEHNLKYMNTIFDFCNVFFFMFFNESKGIKNTEFVFTTLDKMTLCFELYDFEIINGNVSVIPKIKESIFLNYKEKLFESIFSRFNKLDINNLFQSRNLDIFFTNYTIQNNLDPIELKDVIKNFCSDPYVIAWHRQIIKLSEEKCFNISEKDRLDIINEKCSNLIGGFWKYIEQYLVKENISLLKDLKIEPKN